jgi:hypothetical protein
MDDVQHCDSPKNINMFMKVSYAAVTNEREVSCFSTSYLRCEYRLYLNVDTWNSVHSRKGTIDDCLFVRFGGGRC